MARDPKSAPPPSPRGVGERPAVVLAGRANAGKSTLFNRIARRGRAITSAIAGTTRDLNVARAEYAGREFDIVDSGGVELYTREPETERAMEAALHAVAGADVVVLVVDGRAGIASGDRDALALIRATGRPLIVAVNKIEHASQEAAAAEAWALGVETVVNVSAAHGRGIPDLLEAIVARLPAAESALVETAPDLRFALIGRPNVGKSSLFNRLAGYERAIVADRPGTTRDPVDLRLEDHGLSLLLVDTAGIRRPTRVEGELEQHAVGRAIETIRRAEVLALIVDAIEGLTDQDARLAHLAASNDRALLIVINKWDLAAAHGRRLPAFIAQARRRYPFLDFAPILFTSARTGDGVRELIPAAARAGAAWRSRFQTALLNRVLAESLAAMDPPLVAGRRLKLMYVTQIASMPPRLAFFTNLERDIPAHYMRFLESRFRAALGLEEAGTPLRLEFRRAGQSVEARARRAAHLERTE
ncbi:MAG: ribosome biogenesis GTPase Der [Candidatus Binataceae bacterium]